MLAIFFVLLAIAFRFLPHVLSLTPVGASLLYFGARGPRKLLWLPVVLLVAADVLLNKFYYGYPLTLDLVVSAVCYVGMLYLGTLLRKNASPVRLLGASLAVAVGFFIVSNFGVWLVWNMYPKTFSGLMACYVVGLPFFRRELVADLLFTAIFFAVPVAAKALGNAFAKTGDPTAAA